MAVEYHATDFHIMESRLELTGRVTQVRRAVKENVVGNSRLDFASILPAPAHLPVDVPDMKPYAGYAARLFLQDFLCGKGLDTKAMLREEREYLDRHKEVKAGPYLRGKELFLGCKQLGEIVLCRGRLLLLLPPYASVFRLRRILVFGGSLCQLPP